MASSIGIQHPERWASALGGAALLAWGANKLSRERHPLGAVLATTGAGLLWRSTRDGRRARLGATHGTIVEESVAINRPADELYAFWRALDRLPAVMPELSSVRLLDHRRSHWIARGPAGWRTEWYADIINDIPNELIAWRTIERSDVVSAGSVRFEARTRGRGTVVRVKLQYHPPAGKIGAAWAWIFGDSPSQVIREGLRRFKQLMETGEIPTTEGQPRGAR
jgi:uncharacterized membrane protein